LSLFSNYNDVANSRFRKKILNLAEKGILSVMPSTVMGSSIRYSDQNLIINNKLYEISSKRIFIIGAGKASAKMAVELERILGPEKITDGIVISNIKDLKTKKIKLYQGKHPFPDNSSLNFTKKIINLPKKYNIGKDDLVIGLFSGGASSMMTLPYYNIPLDDLLCFLKILIKSGMGVHEMTTLKKNISLVKGGKLAVFFYPAKIISLIISDVIDNDISVIGSGPLYRGNNTQRNPKQILDNYYLKNDIPASINNHFNNRHDDNDIYNDLNVDSYILGDNETAIKSIAKSIMNENISVETNFELSGEARSVAKKICNNVFSKPRKTPKIFLYGGETTVTLNYKNGLGGRNQEFICSCLEYLNENYGEIKCNWSILSIGTDGIDYIKESCGGIIDNKTLLNVIKNNINIEKYLDYHDSYNLLKRLKSNLMIDGGTGTNVCDIVIFYLY
jgi:glycerate 2-kinase